MRYRKLKYGKIVDVGDNGDNLVRPFNGSKILQVRCPPWIIGGDIIPYRVTMRRGYDSTDFGEFMGKKSYGKVVKTLRFSTPVVKPEEGVKEVKVIRAPIDMIELGNIIPYLRIPQPRRDRDFGIFPDKTKGDGSIVVIGYKNHYSENLRRRIHFGVVGFGDLFDQIGLALNPTAEAHEKDENSYLSTVINDTELTGKFGYMWGYNRDPYSLHENLENLLSTHSVGQKTDHRDNFFIDIREISEGKEYDQIDEAVANALFQRLKEHLFS